MDARGNAPSPRTGNDVLEFVNPIEMLASVDDNPAAMTDSPTSHDSEGDPFEGGADGLPDKSPTAKDVLASLESSANESDVKGWDTCIMEGYLGKGGGKTGAKKPKQSWFRMRSYMIVYYKDRKETPGGYGNPKGKIPQSIVLFAESLDAPRMKSYRLASDGPNSFVIVCTSRLFRLVAPSAAERDMWVTAINESICGGENMVEVASLAKVRVSGALTNIAKRFKDKSIPRTVVMIDYLENECGHNHKIFTVLDAVEHPDAVGLQSDMEAAKLTTEAFEQMTSVMECVNAHIDVEDLVAKFQEAGVHAHNPAPPAIQVAFRAEYVRCMTTVFRGDENDAEEEEDEGIDLDEVFDSKLLFEEEVNVDHSIQSKRRRKVLLKLFVDKITWFPIDNKGRVSAKAENAFNFRDIMHCDNSSATTFRIVHFDEKKSLYCFCKSAKQQEICIDHISHAILAYNVTDKGTIASFYLDKQKQVAAGFAACSKAIKKGISSKKDEQGQAFQMVQMYLDQYLPDLFARCKEARFESNDQRLKLGANNPHLAKRKVAADVDAAIHTMSMARACIKAVPRVELYIAQMEAQQVAANSILEMMTPDAMANIFDIERLLENTLADEEDLGVESTMLKGYGHD